MTVQISPIGDRPLRGFTLLEMIVVLTIIGSLLTLAIPFYSKLSPRIYLLSVCHQLLIDLRHAHNNAIEDRKDVAISFYPTRQSYIIDGVEHSIKINIETASDNTQESPETNQTFYFYADGSASPGKITLANAGISENIYIDGMTGKVAADEK